MFFTSITILIDKFGSTVMPALMIPYDTIHMCMHRVGHRLERAANMIIIFITINNNQYSHIY